MSENYMHPFYFWRNYMTCKKNLVFLLPFILLEFGCASVGYISVEPAKNQKAIFVNGMNSVISFGENFVSVTPLDEKFTSEKREEFLFAVKNTSGKDFIFSNENITVESKDSSSESENPLRVYSYEDLIKEEEDRKTWASIGAAIQGASESFKAGSAGYSNTYGTYSGTNGFGSYSGTTYNYAVAQAAKRKAEADTNDRFAAIDAEDQRKKDDLSLTILKKETVFPNAFYGGVVVIEMPELTESSGKLTIKVKAGEEEHIFNFKYSKIKQ